MVNTTAMRYPLFYALLVASAAILAVFTAFNPSVPLLCATAFLAGAVIAVMTIDASDVRRLIREARKR